MIPTLETLLHERREKVRMGEFTPIGRLMIANTPHGIIDFQKSGPTLGKIIEDGRPTEKLVVITAWEGLPVLQKSTDEFCEACLAECDECRGTCVVGCRAFKCGGSGQVRSGSMPCAAPDCLHGTGQTNPNCLVCKGRGETPVFMACAVCGGSGKTKCFTCRGKGRRPTGSLDGSRDRNAKECPSCYGRQRQTILQPQDWRHFVKGTMNGHAILGPIVGFVLFSVTGTPPLVFDVYPDADANYLVLVIEDPEKPHSRAYLLGGVVRMR